ncbi:uncharacterized protein LOC110990195 [Acanthaster planci]|uniref:Uncharacterized protein LOC110990195 n=1 Tax=Acanthaster planci TaxID=133434 RepID=A0A8B7ZZ03_ACAPL|nr:uncharacterized protein LOC110990195 [Acanthaster planci]
MKCVSSADGVFHYVLGELSYDDFDKSGRISMWKLSKLVEGARRARNQSVGPHWGELDMLVFMRSQYFQIHPAFHNVKLTQNHSVELTCTMSHLGQTSYCLECKVWDLTVNKLLATVSTHAVFISQQTRRPIPVAAEAMRLSKTVPSSEKRPISGPQFPARPVRCFSQTRAVMPSDTDSNQHLNQAMFIRFCFDCAGSAALQGKLSAFRNDVLYADAKRLWILYIREARVGEKLTLFCWEDSDLNRTIWVEICLEFQVIGQCQIQFYEGLWCTNSEGDHDKGSPLAKL